MPEKEVAVHGMSLLSYAWALFVVPLRWLWGRGNKQEREIDLLRREIADQRLDSAKNIFDKNEVILIIQTSLNPLQDSILRIEKSIEQLNKNSHERH